MGTGFDIICASFAVMPLKDAQVAVFGLAQRLRAACIPQVPRLVLSTAKGVRRQWCGEVCGAGAAAFWALPAMTFLGVGL